jgi:hypothetical protein
MTRDFQNNKTLNNHQQYLFTAAHSAAGTAFTPVLLNRGCAPPSHQVSQHQHLPVSPLLHTVS